MRALNSVTVAGAEIGDLHDTAVSDNGGNTRDSVVLFGWCKIRLSDVCLGLGQYGEGIGTCRSKLLLSAALSASLTLERVRTCIAGRCGEKETSAFDSGCGLLGYIRLVS